MQVVLALLVMWLGSCVSDVVCSKPGEHMKIQETLVRLASCGCWSRACVCRNCRHAGLINQRYHLLVAAAPECNLKRALNPNPKFRAVINKIGFWNNSTKEPQNSIGKYVGP